jgi:anti-anti-sigma factor
MGFMKYDIRRSDARMVVSMSGRLTFADAMAFPEIVREVNGNGAGGADIDIAGLEFIDSTGMSLFVHIYDAAKAGKFEVTIKNAQGKVRDALSRAGFETLLTFA